MNMAKQPSKPTPQRALTIPVGSKSPHIQGSGAAKKEPKTLTVGRDITLSGEISSCDKLVVEGEVRSTLEGCQSLEIPRGGAFRGKASVVTAQIAGTFEGELDVKDRLILRTTGRVFGTLRYREIEIERGGKIAGTVEIAEDEGAGRREETGQAAKAPQIVA